MIQLDNISADAFQKISVVLDDGTIAVLQLRFLPAIQRWVMDVARGTFSAQSLMVCHHPNLMRQWQKTLPFGIACTTTDGVDPIDISDFESARASLYVLNSDDVAAIETAVIGA